MPRNRKPLPPPARWPRALAHRAAQTGWRLLREAGAVTAHAHGRLRFGAIGEGTRLAFPQGTLFNERWIHLGAHCIIAEQVTLTAGMLPLGPGETLGPDPVLRLGNGVVLGRGSHVVADAPVTIGDEAYFGPYVYVTSTNHSYDDPHQPVGKQWPRRAPVTIGAGSWIGTGAVILPGAHLGRNVVVAAGSVVRGTVPDHAVVAGAPARVVRRWDEATGWEPPLRTPAPVPLPRGASAAQLAALASLDADQLAGLERLAERERERD
ncbi:MULTISPECIES: acyltransferase [unclassified Streptomyces]|uniref:acyltransferase n=1 Tax=unclassified Streptomyces TaxID=2593676 RepID=UPI0004CA3425|nr:acyltransferase [Streptomyces sp. NRRL F-5630]